jgi:hypothetical protein
MFQDETSFNGSNILNHSKGAREFRLSDWSFNMKLVFHIEIFVIIWKHSILQKNSYVNIFIDNIKIF